MLVLRATYMSQRWLIAAALGAPGRIGGVTGRANALVLIAEASNSRKDDRRMEQELLWRA
jgi:hypothetical protein